VWRRRKLNTRQSQATVVTERACQRVPVLFDTRGHQHLPPQNQPPYDRFSVKHTAHEGLQHTHGIVRCMH
jgi:hypothetical protein